MEPSKRKAEPYDPIRREAAAGRLAEASSHLSAHGLILRGGFNFRPDEDAPPGPSGTPARAVLLVGQAGATALPYFLDWRQSQPADLANPLDTWSRAIIGHIAKEFGARAVSPSDRPYLPFQQWAIRAEGLRPSPLGILMHPEFGVWHAYRGALLFDAAIPIQAPRDAVHLCDTCVGKPCLSACPVGAYSEAGFDYAGCLRHVRSAQGETCRSTGCLARNACPHGAAYRYPADVQAFHQRAFAR